MVDLLVFSLVAFMGSAVVDFAVLEFRSIVEIFLFSLSFSSSLSAMQEKGQLSTRVANILPTCLPLLLLSLLSWILYSSTSCKSIKKVVTMSPSKLDMLKSHLAFYLPALHYSVMSQSRSPPFSPSYWALFFMASLPLSTLQLLSFVFWVFLLVWIIYHQISPADIVSLLIMFQCKHAN